MRPPHPSARDHVDQEIDEWRAELPDAATVDLEIVKRVGTLKSRVEAVTHSVLGSYGMTYAEFDVLATLRRAGPPYRLKPSQLARRSMLTTGGTSNILQRLAGAGLVERQRDPADGRSSWVRLTALGVDRAEELALATTDAHKAMLANLSETTARTLADLLRDVILILNEQGPPDTGLRPRLVTPAKRAS